jgi:hypothetical protein
MNNKIVRIDGIKWWINNRIPIPLCPEHNLRMNTIPATLLQYNQYIKSHTNARKLQCAEGPHTFDIPRIWEEEKEYVINRIDAKTFKNMEIIDLDGELTPIAKEKIKDKDSKYFVTTQLMESKRGVQVVVYAGKSGETNKTQIFVEPEIKRLAFDQKNLNPNDVFVELKATFADGSNHTMAKRDEKNEKYK